MPPDFTKKYWHIGPEKVLVAQQNQKEITRIPVEFKVPSVLYLEGGSDFMVDAPRIGVKVAEGIFLGQWFRCKVSSVFGNLLFAQSILFENVAKKNLSIATSFDSCADSTTSKSCKSLISLVSFVRFSHSQLRATSAFAGRTMATNRNTNRHRRDHSFSIR